MCFRNGIYENLFVFVIGYFFGMLFVFYFIGIFFDFILGEN